MAALVKELCIDLLRERLDVNTRVDLLFALQRLIDTEQITATHVRLLYAYSAGYTLNELQADHPLAEQMLVQVLSLLEVTSDYLDESLVQRAIRNRPYHAKIAAVHRRRLAERGRDFSDDIFYDKEFP